MELNSLAHVSITLQKSSVIPTKSLQQLRKKQSEPQMKSRQASTHKFIATLTSSHASQKTSPEFKPTNPDSNTLRSSDEFAGSLLEEAKACVPPCTRQIKRLDQGLPSPNPELQKTVIKTFTRTEATMKNVRTKKVEALKTADISVELFDAILKGDFPRYFPSLINSVNGQGYSPLHLATIYNHPGIFRALLEYKADLNTKGGNSERTSLHLAFQYGCYEICKQLLAHGADITIQDLEGNTPLHIAFRYRYQHENKFPRSFFSDLEAVAGYKEAIRIRNHKGLLPTQLLDAELKQAVANLAFAYCAPKPKMEPRFLPRHKRRTTSKTGKYIVHLPRYSSTNTTCMATDTGSNEPSVAEYPEQKKQSLDSYVILRMLGKGSFGEVYLALENDTKRLYAMKVFQKEKVFSQNMVKYALTEKNIMATMHHPFIVGLHAAFQTKRKLFLVMDYCPGGDMAHALKREGRFPESKARLYIAEIILAIEYLHDQNVIFRDLKPENVVLDKDGHAKLTDFGLSKEGMADNMLTKSFCGSLAYLAPEILRRTGHGKSLDWYLVGVLLYEMLVGQPPYYSKNKEQLFYNITNGFLRLPTYVSPSAKDLIMLLMNRDPKLRLGARKEDAKEIKAHPFFSGMSWDDILQKKIVPPKPVLQPSGMCSKAPKIVDSPEENGTSRIANWSYIECS